MASATSDRLVHSSTPSRQCRRSSALSSTPAHRGGLFAFVTRVEVLMWGAAGLLWNGDRRRRLGNVRLVGAVMAAIW